MLFWLHENRIFYGAYERLRVYYKKKDKKLTKKKLKGIKFVGNESIIRDLRKDISVISEKQDTEMMEMSNRYNELYNIDVSNSN